MALRWTKPKGRPEKVTQFTSSGPYSLWIRFDDGAWLWEVDAGGQTILSGRSPTAELARRFAEAAIVVADPATRPTHA